MTHRESTSSHNDSFINPEKETNVGIRLLQKLDFFSFIPVPKDQPVSTKRSLIGSVVFIVLFLIYIVFDIVQFLQENPPIIENHTSMLDEEPYVLPGVAITFMEGESLNITGPYDEYLNFKLTKQVKDNSYKNDTAVPMKVHEVDYSDSLSWLNNRTQSFYYYLRYPSEQLYAKGLLYSTNNASYSKITVGICNVNIPNNTCEDLQKIASFMAKGRLFLFIEETPDNSGVAPKETSSNRNTFRIANFYLIPRMYKRVTVEYQVIKTTVLPDYFYRWSEQQHTRLVLYSINEQTSNTSINDAELGRQSLQMLGITFQLTAQVLQVRVTYSTLLDHIAKWGAFFNVLFAVFAIFFLAYNKNKFYKKNPDWDRFRKKDQLTDYRQDKQYEQLKS